MKFTIIDVPEELSNVSTNPYVSPIRNVGNNPVPASQLSPNSSNAEAHEALRELALRDGWTALYDPSDEGSLIRDGAGKIIEIEDALGNLPNLKLYNPSGPFVPELRNKGSLRTINGMFTTDPIGGDPDLFALSVSDTQTAGINIPITWGSGVNAYSSPSVLSNSSGNLDLVAVGTLDPSESMVQADFFDYCAQTGGQILGFRPRTLDLRSGYRKIPFDRSMSQPPAYPHQIEGIGFLMEGSNSSGPILIAEGSPNDQAYERMVSLLYKLSGIPFGLPSGTPDAPKTFCTLAASGSVNVEISSHLPNRPELLASVVKLLTVYFARRFVTNAMLDTRIEMFDPYVSSNTPNVSAGDELSWRDCFYASMLRSHNYITQNMAYHVGLMIDPSSSNPRQTFVDYMQAEVNAWGWTGAEIVNAQGQGSKASAQQMAELLLRIYREDTFLRGVIGTQEYTFNVYRQGQSPAEQIPLPNFETPYYGDELLFPEFIGAKGGSLAVTKTHAILWRNPINWLVCATVILESPDNTSQGRWRSTREVMSASERPFGPVTGWNSPRGTVLEWVRAGGGWNYGTAFQDFRFDNGDPQIEPFNVGYAPKHILYPGDEVSVSVRVRAANGTPNSMVQTNCQKVLRSWITGGRFEDSLTDGSIEEVSLSTGWVDMELNGVVQSGGVLNVALLHRNSGSNAVINARDFHVTVRSVQGTVYEYTVDIDGFSMTESSQPRDSSDTSGSVGTFSVSLPKPTLDSVFTRYGHGFLRNKKVRLSTQYGSILGSAKSVSLTNRETLNIDCISDMSVLNAYNVTSPPYSGTLAGLIETYFGLLGSAAPRFSVDPEIASREVTVPGWKGELWYYLKLLCAAEKIQIALDSEGGVRVSASPHSELEHVPEIAFSSSFQDTALAESVEVYNYNSRWVDNELVYPAGGWSEEVEVLSVNAGEYVEQTIDLSASLIDFETPEMREFVGSDYRESSVYTIVGDDGIHIVPQQWRDGGGRVEFELGEDTRSIIVKMTGAQGILNAAGDEIRSFSLALASDTTGSRYSTLRIVGTGVVFDRQLLTINTGISENQTGTKVGVTIDNPFLSNTGMAASAGSLAALKFSGVLPDMTSTLLDPYGKSWGADTVGGVLPSDLVDYRVREVTYSPEGVQVSGEYHLVYDVVQGVLSGETYDDWDALNAGLNYDDLQSRGKKYE